MEKHKLPSKKDVAEFIDKFDRPIPKPPELYDGLNALEKRFVKAYRGDYEQAVREAASIPPGYPVISTVRRLMANDKVKHAIGQINEAIRDYAIASPESVLMKLTEIIRDDSIRPAQQIAACKLLLQFHGELQPEQVASFHAHTSFTVMVAGVEPRDEPPPAAVGRFCAL